MVQSLSIVSFYPVCGTFNNSPLSHMPFNLLVAATTSTSPLLKLSMEQLKILKI
jgi:hypothetical protein